MSHISSDLNFGHIALIQRLGHLKMQPKSVTYAMRIVIQTIPSIPILFANFGMEFTLNSNSSLGIGDKAPTPIQQNWGIPRDSNVCFEIS